MTVSTLSGGQEIVIGRSEALRDMHREVVTLNHSTGSAYVGSFVEYSSQTAGYADLVDDGDMPDAVIERPLIKPSDSWTPATALASGTKVVVIRKGSGVTIKGQINGDDSTTSVKKGAKISAASTGLTVSYKTRGALYVGGSGAAIDNTIMMDQDATLPNTSSAAATSLLAMAW